MSQDQYPYRNPYTTERPVPLTPGLPAAPGATVGATTPSALGVIPDPRLANAFLTHAFVWMFAGLLLSAGVATVVQSNARLLDFAEGNFFLLFIAQIAIVMAIAGAINRISATTALALFFVYAASLGVTIGLIVSSYYRGVGRQRVPERVGDVRRGGRLRGGHEALARGDGRDPVHGPHRAVGGDAHQPVPAEQHASPGSCRSSASCCSPR